MVERASSGEELERLEKQARSAVIVGIAHITVPTVAVTDLLATIQDRDEQIAAEKRVADALRVDRNSWRHQAKQLDEQSAAVEKLWRKWERLASVEKRLAAIELREALSSGGSKKRD